MFEGCHLCSIHRSSLICIHLSSLQLQRTVETVDSLEQSHSQTVAEVADMEVGFASYPSNALLNTFLLCCTEISSSIDRRDCCFEGRARQEEGDHPTTVPVDGREQARFSEE